MSLQPHRGVFPSDHGRTFLPAVLHVPLVWKQEGLNVQELWCRDALGLGRLRDCCGATQGGLQGCVSMGVLLLASSWCSWMVLSSGWTCCPIQPCAGCQQRAHRPASSCPLPRALLVGFVLTPVQIGCLANLLGKLGKTHPVGGERLKL